ncbi:helix-turn-helix domain-containing protein [Ureibacillus sp. FSL K6-0165]|uniref:helix-turn-helix domain-containing protein n=1 Tax=Ureibacillus sp. FSL K6-0165 TaxID=2954606 RepID=UPI0030F72F0C
MCCQYPNLKAEMARYGVRQVDIANLLGVREGTVSDKMNGKSVFDIDEAFKIKMKFFPHLLLDYLFSKSKSDVA